MNDEKDKNGKGERVMIFIDGSNLYKSMQKSFGMMPDNINDVNTIKKIIDFLKEDRLLVAVYYYNAPLDRSYNKDVYSLQQKFFSKLKRIPGLHLVLVDMRKYPKEDGTPGYKVKGDDVHLAVDMVKFAYEDAYDTAILVSGDGDFKPAVKTVQKIGKGVENAYFYVSRSGLLKQICNRSISLYEFVRDVCLKMQEHKDK